MYLNAELEQLLYLIALFNLRPSHTCNANARENPSTTQLKFEQCETMVDRSCFACLHLSLNFPETDKQTNKQNLCRATAHCE